jgi:hypothetical protein
MSRPEKPKLLQPGPNLSPRIQIQKSKILSQKPRFSDRTLAPGSVSPEIGTSHRHV